MSVCEQFAHALSHRILRLRAGFGLLRITMALI
jgi:hypothetical protein